MRFIGKRFEVAKYLQPKKSKDTDAIHRSHIAVVAANYFNNRRILLGGDIGKISLETVNTIIKEIEDEKHGK